MTSILFLENVFVLRIRDKIRVWVRVKVSVEVRVRVSGNRFKNAFGQTSIRTTKILQREGLENRKFL